MARDNYAAAEEYGGKEGHNTSKLVMAMQRRRKLSKTGKPLKVLRRIRFRTITTETEEEAGIADEKQSEVDNTYVKEEEEYQA